MKSFICLNFTVPTPRTSQRHSGSLRSAFFGLLIALTGGDAHAAFISPDWQRGSEGSAYLEWDIFAGRVNTTPDVGSSHIASSVLTEQIGQSFVTSSGNLYSFSSAQAYTLSVITDSHGPSPIARSVQVQLQIRTLTFGIDGSLVTLNGQAGDVTLLGSGAFPNPIFGGTVPAYEYLFEWNVVASSLYQFAWNLHEHSTALDAVVLDMYSSGAAAEVLLYPSLPILAAIPGSSLFNGQQLTAAHFPDTAQTLAAVGRASVSPVPVPAAAPLMISALLGLVGFKRKSVNAR